jgi:phosphate transport system substrate-binding protein
MNTRAVAFLAAFLAATALAPVAALAERLEIPGSGNPEYALARLAEAFNARQAEHQVTVPGSIGTSGAVREVESGAASLARVGRPLKEDEAARGLVYVSLGRDPVVFAAGADVMVRSITSEQVLAVYSGKLTDWKDLGGKPGPIRAIGREVSDASRQAIGLHLKLFGEMEFPGNIKVVHLDPQLVELLDRYPTSLGFLNMSGLKACKSKVVHLAFNGVEPTVENMNAGRYPLWLEFGLIYKANALTPAGKAFLAFVNSPAGGDVLRGLGVQPATAH